MLSEERQSNGENYALGVYYFSILKDRPLKEQIEGVRKIAKGEKLFQ